jgi:hypothetical protein
MQVNAISQTYNNTIKSFLINKKEKPDVQSIVYDNESYKVALSMESTTVKSTYTAEVNGLNESKGKNNLQEVENNLPENLVKTKEDIRKEIELQTIQLLSKYLEGFPEVKQSLNEFFVNNPEALVDIEAGKIPEYFNVENTAKRILDIYFSQYNGEDKKAFVERAKGIISQAYSEVEQMVGTLPDIVIQTRDKVYEILDKFANGGEVSDFIKINNG